MLGRGTATGRRTPVVSLTYRAGALSPTPLDAAACQTARILEAAPVNHRLRLVTAPRAYTAVDSQSSVKVTTPPSCRQGAHTQGSTAPPIGRPSGTA